VPEVRLIPASVNGMSPGLGQTVGVVSGNVLVFEKLGVLTLCMPVWYFLAIYYVLLNFMDWMRPRLLSIYFYREPRFRIGLGAGRDDQQIYRALKAIP